MISINQIRGARGLLDWSQSDLARICGISLTAINNIDRGHTSPRLKTLRKIQSVLEDAGIEFTIGHGVRMRTEVFKIQSFEGPEAFPNFLTNVLETLKSEGGEALHILESEDDFIKNYREVGFHYYKEFVKHNFREKILISEGSIITYGPAQTSTYRWIPKALATQVLSTVYGNKYTIYLANKIVTIENPDIAETYRKRFYASWNTAEHMPFSTPLFNEDLKRKGRSQM